MTRTLNDYTLTDLKLAYVTLHDALLERPALLDSLLLEDLQTALQQRANGAGIDATVHGDWDHWLRQDID